jgi:hypothetical protein
MSGRREEALIRLADLRVRQGRIDEAAELLAGLEGHPDAVRAAAIYHSRGETTLARDLLERRTGGSTSGDAPSVGRLAAPAVAFLTLIAIVWVANLRTDGPRSTNPRWSTVVETARTQCRAEPVDAVTVPSGGDWWAKLPCADLRE